MMVSGMAIAGTLGHDAGWPLADAHAAAHDDAYP